MKSLHMVGFVLVMIGALNWGIVGLGYWFGAGWSWNVVDMILGSWPAIEALVYVLVGLAGLWLIWKHKGDCRVCGSSMGGGMGM